jgi:hypothetical protein
LGDHGQLVKSPLKYLRIEWALVLEIQLLGQLGDRKERDLRAYWKWVQSGSEGWVYDPSIVLIDVVP